MGAEPKHGQRYDGTFLGFPLRIVSLVLLTFQNSALILLLHYSRIAPHPGRRRYITSTAVFMNELIKFSVCLTVSLYEQSRSLPSSLPATALFSNLSGAIFAGDSWKLAIPASLYVVQNSLQYVAISNLDTATYQVTYQLKILPTAIFSILILKRSLTLRKWLSMGLLMVGIAIVQIPTTDPHLAPFKITHPHWHVPRSMESWRHVKALAGHQLYKRSATYQGIAEDEGIAGEPQMNPALGFFSAVAGCTVSALASVYFEKILKESINPASLWIRNVQLAFYSLFPSLFIGVMFIDGETIAHNGFFVGYNWIVWLSITAQSVGGVLVSLCIMYADNIAKTFAMTLSILVGLCASVWLFDFPIHTNFLIGTTIVLTATYLYNTGAPSYTIPPPLKIHDYEKTTIGKDNGRQNGLPKKLPTTPLKAQGLSSSRPTSPTGHHHFRTGSSREHFGAKLQLD